MPSSTVRRALDLRSTWVTIGTLSLSRPAGMAPAGVPLTLTGTARQVKGPIELQSKVGGGAWTDGIAVDLAADRSFAIDVVPEATTQYRLTAADDVLSVPLRVPVAPASRSLSIVSKPRSAAVPAAPAFLVNDPLAGRQWHLAFVRAFDFWAELPFLDPVTVAVVDTGIDIGHPDLAGNVIAAKSFVGGTADDPIGHGTFVAGLIAAEIDNAVGIAGMAFPAELLVARVATADGDIDAAVEAKAIRWAVNRGARVINLSIGGLRDPLNRSRDTFSQEEADAVAYAHSKGVVVVASVGNGDSAPTSPWPFASYPAALPHVIGVSAVSQSGSVPGFSNRDAVFNDLAAPGQGLVSTSPRKLTAEKPALPRPGLFDLRTLRPQGRSRDVVLDSSGDGGRGSVACREPEADTRSGGCHHRALDGGREGDHRLRSVRRRPRLALRLGDAGRHRRAGGAGRAVARRRPLRVERRRRDARRDDLRPRARGEGHARLLGRPGRRLPGQRRQGRAAEGVPARAGGHADEPHPLAPGHTACGRAFDERAANALDAVRAGGRERGAVVPGGGRRLVLRRR